MSSAASDPRVSPRRFADKRAKSSLLAAIRMALEVESAAVRHNTQSFNQGRYAAVAALPEYEQLKDQAKAIKENALERLPALINTLEGSVTRNGGHFFLAEDAAAATSYVREVLRRAKVRLAVKGKSMTSEEVGLNRALKELGIEVVETDLAEFILQAADEQPSHIIAPAIHYSRERITALFQRVFQTNEPLDTGEALTIFARERLREKFLSAEAGITGANLIAADSGTLLLVESEANIRMASLIPPLHIVISGIEKIVSSREDFGPFVELLAASGTGQAMTSYTTILSAPVLAAPVLCDSDLPPKREFHLVLVDNGRTKMQQDAVLNEALRCIRCGACLNVCANFQTVGGHAFGGETYSGGIGGAWEAGTHGLGFARFSELCTGCSRCIPQCPVRIDIPWLNTALRRRLFQTESRLPTSVPQIFDEGAARHDRGAPLQKLFFGRYEKFAKWGVRSARLSNWLARISLARIFLELAAGVDRRRTLPPFARSTLVQEAARRERRTQATSGSRQGLDKAVLFADVFTNFGSPECGLATLEVLEFLGVDVIVSEALPDGRAAFSQGLLGAASAQARLAAKRLQQYLEDEREIIVVEPSVLTMFRMDYQHLLSGGPDSHLFRTLSEHCYDPGEYVLRLLQTHDLNSAELFPAANSRRGLYVFFHGHCQQKTIGADRASALLLRAAGFDVVNSQVECCGMAGSFGYKKEFFELSMAVGQDLFRQVKGLEAVGARRTLVASGVSCREQLHAGLGREVLHPMQLLAELLGGKDKRRA